MKKLSNELVLNHYKEALGNNEYLNNLSRIELIKVLELCQLHIYETEKSINKMEALIIAIPKNEKELHFNRIRQVRLENKKRLEKLLIDMIESKKIGKLNLVDTLEKVKNFESYLTNLNLNQIEKIKQDYLNSLPTNLFPLLFALKRLNFIDLSFFTSIKPTQQFYSLRESEWLKCSVKAFYSMYGNYSNIIKSKYVKLIDDAVIYLEETKSNLS